ncbi:MAG: 50S ribosomal protein L6 [Gammaproteobacteria bacterium]|nr:50S ribosomal protein L6 [Gammaproteobacteria bacterium]
MSRVAKANIILPAHVELKVEENMITVKGPKGSLTQHVNHTVDVKQITGEGNETVIQFRPKKDQTKAWSHAGTARAVVNNMVCGVTDGYKTTLELVGVGYRVQAAQHMLTLSVGYSHPVEYKLPKGISAESPSNTVVILQGIDKQLIGQVAAEIRSIRPPEPYKGKGIRYLGEVIIKKEAKKK